MAKSTIEGLVSRARHLNYQLSKEGFTLIAIDLIATLMRKDIQVETMAQSIKRIVKKEREEK